MADWLDSHLIVGTLIPFLIFLIVVGVISFMQCWKFRANRRSEKASEELAEAYETIRAKQIQGMAEAQDFIPQIPGRPQERQEAERAAAAVPSPDAVPNMPAPMNVAERDFPRPRLDSISDGNNSTERLLMSNASSPEPEPSHLPVQSIALEPEPVVISPSGSSDHNTVLQKLAEKKEHEKKEQLGKIEQERKEAMQELSRFQLEQQRFNERQLDLERQDDLQRDRQQPASSVSPLDAQIPPAPPRPEDSNTPKYFPPRAFPTAPAPAPAPAPPPVPVVEGTAQLKKELPPSYNPGLMDLPMKSAIVPVHPPASAVAAEPPPENTVTYHRPPVLVSPEPSPNPDSTVSSIPAALSQGEEQGSPRIPTLEFALSSRENRILQNLEQLERNDRARASQPRVPREKDTSGMLGRVSNRFESRGANPIPDFFGYPSPDGPRIGQAAPSSGQPTPSQPNKSDAQWLDSMRSLRPWSGATTDSSPITVGQHSSTQGHPHRGAPKGPMIFPANPPPKPELYPQFSGQVASGDVIPQAKSPTAPAGRTGQGLGPTDPAMGAKFGMVRPQSGPMDPRRLRQRQEQQSHQQASLFPRTEVWSNQQQQMASF